MAGEWIETVYGSFAADFAESRLRDLCEPETGIQTGPFGSQLHQEDYVSDGTPIITVEHLGENRILHGDVPRVSDFDRDRLSRYWLRTGDIVFSRVGSVDRRAIVRTAEDGWMFSGRCLRVRPNREKIDSEYLSYFFGLPAFKEHIRAVAVGATMPSLNTAILSDVVVVYPRDLAEQRAIAHILGTLDDKIELNRRRNQTLEAMARALFKDWFVDFGPVHAKMEGRARQDGARSGQPRTPQASDLPWPGAEAGAGAQGEPYLPADLWQLFPDRLDDDGKPEGWSTVPLLEALDLQGGSQPPAKEFISDPRERYVRLLQIRDFSSDAHATYVPKTKKLRLAAEDDILIGRYGSASGNKSKDSLGRICRGLAGAYNVALMKVVPLLVGREYCFQILDDERFYSYLQGISSKAVQSGFSKQELAQYRVALPPSGLVDEFERFGIDIYKRRKQLRIENTLLAQLRDTLLPKLISGELRITDVEKLIERAS